MFQRTTNLQPSPGVEGGIASNNPLIGYVTGPGGLISGPNGVIVGRFAWATPQTSVNGAIAGERVDNNANLVAAGVSRAPSGFVANEQQGLNTVYLAESGLSILPGQAMSAFTRGDFWAKAAAAVTQRALKVFANLADGTMQAALSGTTVAAKIYTASFATNVMTVTVAPGTALAVGDAVLGAGLPANTYIASFGTGTGGTGTYNLTTTPGTIAAQSTTSTSWVETRFTALSTALANEIFKIGFGD